MLRLRADIEDLEREQKDILEAIGVLERLQNRLSNRTATLEQIKQTVALLKKIESGIVQDLGSKYYTLLGV